MGVAVRTDSLNPSNFLAIPLDLRSVVGGTVLPRLIVLDLILLICFVPRLSKAVTKNTGDFSLRFTLR
jgi:hypothetical protein